MFRNYLTVAWRNLVRHKLYSVINIVGLAIGLTCVLFVVLFIRDELSYDKWIPGTQDLYRVELTIRLPDRPPLPLAVIPYPMLPAMRDEIPGVTGMTQLHWQPLTLTSGDRQFPQTVNVVDPNFFGIMRLPLVAGSPDTVFRQPESVVLSQSAVKKYFGAADPMGRFLTASTAACDAKNTACQNETVALRVTGIVKNLPHDTQLTGDVFIPDTSRADRSWDQLKHDWFSENGWGYVTLAPGVDPAVVVARMAPLLNRSVTPMLRKYGLRIRGSQAYSVHLTPFTRVHLDSAQWRFNATPPGSWMTIYGVAAVGVLILLSACFNFMNLATAVALVRAREIALRKIVGASRRQLIVQFLGEAVLTALLSLALALAAGEMLLPVLDRFLGHPIGWRYASDGGLILLLVGIAVVTGLVSGSYPALVLSGFRPIAAFRTDGLRRAEPWSLRNLLVMAQFAVSIGLGVAAGVVFNQISYARHINLGFRHDDIVVIANSDLEGRRLQDFADALRTIPGVASVGLSDIVPFEPGQMLSAIHVPGQPDLVTLNTVIIGPDYPATYGIPLVAGRPLSVSRGDDRLSSIGIVTGGDPGNEGRDVLINAAAARRLGFTPREAAGKTIEYNHNHVHIVGVLADTKVQGARQSVSPTVYIYIPNYPMSLSVRLRPRNALQTLSLIDRTWHAFVPTVAIQRYFLDQTYGQLYQQDDRQGTLFGVFVTIAILIGCLGLYGLAVFSAERRAKEIGLRKVSGACTGDIVKLMLWRMSVPVLMANVVAWPVAYFYLRRWLAGFAYRIPLDPLYFLAAGVAALLIAWATVSAHTVRLARTSPARTLRYE